jgi:hypothetical protein
MKQSKIKKLTALGYENSLNSCPEKCVNLREAIKEILENLLSKPLK